MEVSFSQPGQHDDLNLQSFPLKSLEAVLSWKPEEWDTVPHDALFLPRTRSGRSQALLCHDMKGGYLEDRFLQGICGKDKCQDYYNFYHWQNIDLFVYFSHEMVTIPPSVWTIAGHKNGVKILGTFITEWEPGKKSMEAILQNDESYKTFANQLVSIAKHYKFDGWLVNIENIIQKEKVPALLDFMKYLTTEMHRIVENSIVIWYDSVTKEGELDWQNQVNQKNEDFFQSCDGIFLNYCWDKTGLETTLLENGNRATDIFVGVDVFGRGCYGGGGWNTDKALELIASCKTSTTSCQAGAGLATAIFAPGWVLERLDLNQFYQHQNKFWKMVGNSLCAPDEKCRIICLPILSSFCRGYGSKYYSQGEVVRDEPWICLAEQSLQAASNSEGLEFTTEDSFCGGGCLLCRLSPQQLQQENLYTLFKADIGLTHPLLVNWTYKLAPSLNPCIVPGLYIKISDSSEDATYFQLLFDNPDKKKNFNSPDGEDNSIEFLEKNLIPTSLQPNNRVKMFDSLSGKSVDELNLLFIGPKSSRNSSWQSKYYNISEKHFPSKQCRLKEIGFFLKNFKSEILEKQIEIKVGNIKILDPESLDKRIEPVEDLGWKDVIWHRQAVIPEGSEPPSKKLHILLNLTLQWYYMEAVSHFLIYEVVQNHIGRHNYIGCSYTRAYRIANYELPYNQQSNHQFVEFAVQPVLKSGQLQPFAQATRAKIYYE